MALLHSSHGENGTHSAMTTRRRQERCLPPTPPLRGGSAPCAVVKVRIAVLVSRQAPSAAAGCELVHVLRDRSTVAIPTAAT